MGGARSGQDWEFPILVGAELPLILFSFVLCLRDTGEVRLFRDLDVIREEHWVFDSAGTLVNLAAEQDWEMPKASLSIVSKEGFLRDWILKNYSINPEIEACNNLAGMVKVLTRLYGYGAE